MVPSQDNTPVWQMVPGLALHSKTWGEQCVLYNADSGTTHMLDDVAHTVIGLLEENACDSQSLANQLARAYDAETDAESNAELLQYLDSLLQQLQKLELVEMQTESKEPLIKASAPAHTPCLRPCRQFLGE